jgi:hypothetical protein
VAVAELAAIPKEDVPKRVLPYSTGVGGFSEIVSRPPIPTVIVRFLFSPGIVDIVYLLIG